MINNLTLKHWEEIINTLNDALMLVDNNGNIQLINRAFESLTGYSSDEIKGMSCTILNCDVCERVLNKDQNRWCMLFSTGKVERKRCIIMRKDGTYVSVLKNATILMDEKQNPIGAIETLTDMSEVDKLDEEIDNLTLHLEREGGFYGIIGKTPQMERLFKIIERAALSDSPVIIYGESGTGKELVAMAIHKLSSRRKGPFVHLNCAALNESILESELFGHIKGAFTGAYRHKMGRFEAAHKGSIFLDEIGDIPLSIQVKLLRVIETKQFERVGDHRSIYVDTRIIAATNKDLESLISKGEFREDLFFRINVIPIYVPPLRERPDDIPLLVNTFIRRLRSRTGKRITGLTPSAMELFIHYGWPGNVRELKSTLEYAFVIGEEGLIDIDHLPPHLQKASLNSKLLNTLTRKEIEEKNMLIEALRKAGGNKSLAARILGINRVTVWNRMRKYGINLEKVIHS